MTRAAAWAAEGRHGSIGAPQRGECEHRVLSPPKGANVIATSRPVKRGLSRPGQALATNADEAAIEAGKARLGDPGRRSALPRKAASGSSARISYSRH